MEPQRFTATTEDGGRGRVAIPVPFDPDVAWGVKSAHHVTGTVDGCDLRAVVESTDKDRRIVMGPTWGRDRGIGAGRVVEVELVPEGPQRDDLAPDVASALAASVQAGTFFDSLAQFYRRGYLRWIDATRRRPDERVRRIAVVVDLLERGIKERPDQGARSVRRVISGGDPTRTGGPQNPVPRVT